MKRPLLLLLAFAGCIDDPFHSWLVDRTRLLGARTELVTDPNRASIAVGESATITWLVAGPATLPSFSYAWAACAPPGGDLPTPRCEGPVLASGTGTGLTMPLVMPAITGGSLFVLGAFCADGPPTLDPVGFNATCAHGDALIGTTTIATDGPNFNPPIDASDITLNGVVLPASILGPVDAPCTGAPEAPVVLSSGGERAFGFHFHDEQRENVGPVREALIVSHVVTAGELDRQYSAFDPNESGPKDVVVTWKPPPARDVPDAGRIIELFFVLRDGRGGTTFARRTLCARSH